MLQFGRQNIEIERKRNGTWHIEEDDSEDEGGGTPSSQKNHNSCNSKQKGEKTQNGVVGNSVIARNKDLILVPEPEVQNHKDQLENEERNKTDEQLSIPNDNKEVISLN